jgi:hypothetical protein
MMLDTDDRAAVRSALAYIVIVCGGVPVLAVMLGGAFRLFRLVAGV